MRTSLKQLLSSAIALEYRLPNGTINKVVVSTEPDDCLRNQTTSDDMKEIIYNGLIDYGIEEENIDISRLSKLHKLVLKTKIKYDPNDTFAAKIKYGFFGEVMLYLILNHFYNASTLISRGYFFNPLERSETKGYDTYQIREDADGNVELWFGEVKFYEKYTQALSLIFKNITKALSDDYLCLNFKAFVNHIDKMQHSSRATRIVETIMDDPDVNVMQLIQQENMTLVYPALLICDDKNKPYDDIVKEIVDYINKKFKSITTTLCINYKFFFIILPVHDSKNIKSDIIQWIGSNHPLI